MAKIQMKTPLVEMDGDEMTRVLWQWIKDILLTPYVDLKTEYYDLGLEYREKTKDQVTVDSANATKKYGIQPVPDVEKPERHHSCHSGRYRFPYSDSGKGRRAV